MDTRRIDDALSMLSLAETWISNRARTNEEYRFASEIRSTVRDAKKELSALHRSETTKVVYVGEDFRTPDECYCNADNAPCGWCESHCAECGEDIDECTCT